MYPTKTEGKETEKTIGATEAGVAGAPTGTQNVTNNTATEDPTKTQNVNEELQKHLNDVTAELNNVKNVQDTMNNNLKNQIPSIIYNTLITEKINTFANECNKKTNDQRTEIEQSVLEAKAKKLLNNILEQTQEKGSLFIDELIHKHPTLIQGLVIQKSNIDKINLIHHAIINPSTQQQTATADQNNKNKDGK